MKAAMLGRNGFIAKRLAVRLMSDMEVVQFSKAELDLTGDLTKLLAVKPDLIVCAAGLKDVAACERDPDAAMAVNAAWIAALPPAIKLVYLSTDYVFDGNSRRTWTELSRPQPTTVYGRSKLAGELLTAARPGSLIVRTGGVYGRGSTLTEWLAGGSGPVSCYANVHSSPTYVGDLCDFVAAAIADDLDGLIHFSCGERVSRPRLIGELCTAVGVQRSTIMAVAPAGLIPPELALNCDKATCLGYAIPSLAAGMRRMQREG